MTGGMSFAQFIIWHTIVVFLRKKIQQQLTSP
uniref:Uncharacterized protein n=1 Tax=Rhizophora mucronata TaxID=61149 RepID=A0A2P2NC62_RHIMU